MSKEPEKGDLGKGRHKGERTLKVEGNPHFFCLASQPSGRRRTLSLSLGVVFGVRTKRNPYRSGGPWDVVELDTTQRLLDDESGEYGVETPTQFFEKKRKELEADFSP